ncbi:MAG: superoxide dismutase [Candidatus Latescibacteria bacterium]|nr:superoxide dismutase [bacterium]MBD3424116.1 superoxide dismutase [Candidatus Latescibacterota bacterium]
MKARKTSVLFLILMALSARTAVAHCEIPCGIYDDRMRIEMIREHIDTIEKSMNMIEKLTGSEEKNYNQIVRWISNKEEHAEALQHIVWQYFMTQRIKPVDPGDDGYGHYAEQTVLLHRMLVHSMKSKQTLDMAHISALRKLVDSFEKAYFKD